MNHHSRFYIGLTAKSRHEKWNAKRKAFDNPPRYEHGQASSYGMAMEKAREFWAAYDDDHWIKEVNICVPKGKEFEKIFEYKTNVQPPAKAGKEATQTKDSPEKEATKDQSQKQKAGKAGKGVRQKAGTVLT